MAKDGFGPEIFGVEIGGEGYAPETPDTLPAYLEGKPDLAARLGGRPADWKAVELGDGNLNLVFIVTGPQGRLCVKQALPYVRLVGESWPLPLDRAYFEHEALTRQAARAPGLTPEIHHFDPVKALIVMEALQPHIILRKGFIRGIEYPTLAEKMSRFCARTLFLGSDLTLGAAEKKAEIARFAPNTALCRITEDLVFTDYFREHELNRWTSPQLDETVRALRADAEWKIATQELKHAFLTRAETLIHGDLHSASVMVHEDDVRAIDPEFAFYGPMGFDLGAYVANVLLAFFSQRGHETRPGGREAMRAWLLAHVGEFWERFATAFRALWREARTGDLHPRTLYEDQGQGEASERACERLLERLARDTLGFAGAKMTRRILGLAHVEDLESIADPGVRAACERRALTLARELVVDPGAFAHPAAAARRAAEIEEAAR